MARRSVSKFPAPNQACTQLRATVCSCEHLFAIARGFSHTTKITQGYETGYGPESAVSHRELGGLSLRHCKGPACGPFAMAERRVRTPGPGGSHDRWIPIARLLTCAVRKLSLRSRAANAHPSRRKRMRTPGQGVRTIGGCTIARLLTCSVCRLRSWPRAANSQPFSPLILQRQAIDLLGVLILLRLLQSRICAQIHAVRLARV